MNRTIRAIISVRVAAAMALTFAVSACSGTSTNSSPGTSAASSAIVASQATTVVQQEDLQRAGIGFATVKWSSPPPMLPLPKMPVRSL